MFILKSYKKIASLFILCSITILCACSDTTQLTGSGSITAGSSTSEIRGVLAFDPTPEFYETFTAPSIQGKYYNNFTWTAAIATMSGGCAASVDRLGLTATTVEDTGNGFMSFTVNAGLPLTGAEIVTNRNDFHYGLYEVRMKISPIPGVVNAFFWQSAGATIVEEIDIEFLTNESSGSSGIMRCTIHPKPDNQEHLDPLHQQLVNLAFNPSDAFHVYGFHWTENLLIYYVDGTEVCRFVRSEGAVIPTLSGYIWANCWTGNAFFGGGPPTANATMVYDWVKFWPEVGSSISTEYAEKN